jgi:hypothetical protein
MDDRNRYHFLKALKRSHNQRAVRPRTSETDVKVVTVAVGWDLAGAVSLGRHPPSKCAIRAHKLAASGRRVIPFIIPYAVDEQAHEQASFVDAGSGI